MAVIKLECSNRTIPLESSKVEQCFKFGFDIHVHIQESMCTQPTVIQDLGTGLYQDHSLQTSLKTNAADIVYQYFNQVCACNITY